MGWDQGWRNEAGKDDSGVFVRENEATGAQMEKSEGGNISGVA